MRFQSGPSLIACTLSPHELLVACSLFDQGLGFMSVSEAIVLDLRPNAVALCEVAAVSLSRILGFNVLKMPMQHERWSAVPGRT